jgi:hypothetical protein
MSDFLPDFTSKFLPEYGLSKKPAPGATLVPYYQEEKEKRRNRLNLMQPLAKLFDILQVGQYVSANVVDEVLDSLHDGESLSQNIRDVLSAAWEGLEAGFAGGERKGSFVDVLKEHAPGTARKWRPGAEKGLFKNTTWAGVLGFLGDVLLDPTTYIGLRFPTKAISAAKAFARDTSTIALKRLGDSLPELAKIAGKGFDVKHAQGLMKAALEGAGKADDVIEYVSKFSGETAYRMNEVYKEAYRHALRTPSSQLRKELGSQLEEVVDYYNRIGMEKADDLTDFIGADLRRTIFGAESAPAGQFLPKEISDIRTGLQTAYEGAGTRGMRFLGFGKHMPEWGVGPAGQGWDQFIRRIHQAPASQRFSKAWYGIMNKGLIGKIKKDLGIRNPYQKMLRYYELQEGEHKFVSEVNRRAGEVLRITRKYDDETRNNLVKLFDYAEAHYKKDKDVYTQITDYLDDPNPAVRIKLGIEEESAWELRKLAEEYTNLMRSYSHEYAGWRGERLVGNMTDLPFYMPTVFTDPKLIKRRVSRAISGENAPFTLHRGYTRAQTTAQESAKLQWVFGVDKATADTMIRDFGISGLGMDLEELMLVRAYSQAKVSMRVNMIRKFREFGIPLDDLRSVAPEIEGSINTLKSALRRPGGAVPSLGLWHVETAGLENFVFDGDVAEILARASEMTSPQHMHGVKRLIHGITSWWKGMVTMTTGFHARNMYSNNITGIMKHGMKWLNVQDHMAALAGVTYVLRQTDPATMLKEINMDEGTFWSYLNRHYGDKTVKELAEEAYQRGVISEATHGFDVQTAIEKVSGRKKRSIDPFSNRFVGRDVSFRIGSYVENQPKLLSTMLDYKGMYEGIGAGATRSLDDALDFAMMESKKWWIDYQDLTEFERGVMKTVFPFYTWLRHNISNQISGVLLYPDTFSLFPKIQDAFTYEDDDFDPDILPDWMKQLGMFPTAEVEPGVMAMFNPNFPYQDINKIPLMWEEGGLLPRPSFKEIKDDIVNMTHPLIKTAMNLMTEKGYDFFYKEELEDTRRAPFVLRLMLSHPRMLGMMDGIMRWAGREEGFQAEIDDKGKLRLDGKMMKILEDNLPILRHLDMAFNAAMLIPGFEEALETLTHAEDDYEGIDQFFQVLAFYGGIKFKPLDIEKEKYNIAKDLYVKAQEKMRGEVKRTPSSQVRSMISRQNFERQVRRFGQL